MLHKTLKDVRCRDYTDLDSLKLYFPKVHVFRQRKSLFIRKGLQGPRKPLFQSLFRGMNC